MNRIFVFADRDTGKIRGWIMTHPSNLANQPLGANETTVEVSRQPTETDRYVNFMGEMRSDA